MLDISNLENILNLIRKYKNETLSIEEASHLALWKNTNEANQRMFEKLTNDSFIGNDLMELSNVDTNPYKSEIFRRLGIFRKVNYIYRGLVAACLLCAIIVFGIYKFEKNTNTKLAHLHKKGKSSMAPKGVVLTLSNGQTILLDTIKNGKIASQGNVDIINQNGKITYINRQTGEAVRGDNTVTTPKCKLFELTLPDNIKVWINSESSLRYPVSFSTKERLVYLSGEAYFEVAKNKHLPFIVVTEKERVKVLGTHFNISCYSNQDIVKTTLLEGRVQVNLLNGKDSVSLSPGQQSHVTINHRIKVIDHIDENEVLAWKNGLFVFYKTSLPEILKTLSNWYDVKIEYKDRVEDCYTLTISRAISLPQLLQYLEKSGGVHLTMKNNTIIVTQ